MNAQETAPVTTEVVERTGIITLDRPRALNSLNGEMVALIAGALDAWRDDDAIDRVVLRSSGKHFCAGGDVRAAREGVLSGRAADVDRFFEEEYALKDRKSVV